MPNAKVVPQFKVGDVVWLRRIPQEVHHIPRWTYRIAQVLEGTWDESLIYRIALTLEPESKYLQEKLAEFRRANEQEHGNAVRGEHPNAKGHEGAVSSGASKA